MLLHTLVLSFPSLLFIHRMDLDTANVAARVVKDIPRVFNILCCNRGHAGCRGTTLLWMSTYIYVTHIFTYYVLRIA